MAERINESFDELAEGVKKWIKNFKAISAKAGEAAGSEHIINKNTIEVFSGKISKILKMEELRNGTKYYVMEKIKGKLMYPEKLFSSEGNIDTESLIETINMGENQVYQQLKRSGTAILERV